MDWSEAIEKEREVLKRIVALFYALAVLTDRACRRSHPVRCLVLWILRPALAVALDYIDEAGLQQDAFVRQNDDSLAEAKRFSRCFRAAARSMKGLIKTLDRCQAGEDGSLICAGHLPEFGASFGRRSTSSDLLASLGSLVAATTKFSACASATAVLLPERRDSS